MPATFVDLLKGYEYFINKGGKASLEEINDFLINSDRNEISKRAYTHYRSLMRYGFSSYFPINQFDVSRMLGQLPVAPDRRRYARENVEIEVMVSKDKNTWIPAKIIDKSIIGYGLLTSQKLSIKRRNLIWIRIENYHDIPARLIWKKDEENQIRFGVRAIEFITKYQIVKEKIIIDKFMGQLILRKNSKGDISWNEIYNLVAKMEKLIDASSCLLNRIGKTINRDVKISSSVLSSIKFSSPGELIVFVDWKMIGLIIVLIRIIQLWRLEKDRFKQEIRTISLDNDMRELQIEIARKAIRSRKKIDLDIIRQVLSEIATWIKRIFNIKDLPSNLFESESLEKGIIQEQLLPVLLDLIAGDDPQIEIEAKESSVDELEKK
jgi:hypothetical protein